MSLLQNLSDDRVGGGLRRPERVGRAAGRRCEARAGGPRSLGSWGAESAHAPPASARGGSSCEGTAIEAAHERGEFVVVVPNEPVWWTLRTLGMERALIAMAAEPAWFEEMVAAQTDMQIELIRMAIDAGARPPVHVAMHPLASGAGP